MATFTFRGLTAPVFTAFNKDWSVNTGAVIKYAKFLKDGGVPGVLVNGTNGEGPLMSVDERKTNAEAWVDAAKETKQHVMVQVGGCPLPDVKKLAGHAEKIGANSILCLPELFFSPKTPQELIDYLKLVSEAAPNTPLLYYHNPGQTRIDINMEQFSNLSVGQIPTLQGIKYTANDLSEGYNALKAANGRYAIFLGLGANTLIQPTFALGFDSAVCSPLSFIPGHLIKIINALKENKIEEARIAQDKLTAICRTIVSYGPWVAAMKTAMNALTPVNVGLARPPTKNLTEAQQKDMATSLEKYLP